MDFNSWFLERGLNSLGYQEEILTKRLPTAFKNTKLPVVLAASPSAGKTIMSIFWIDKYLETNPDHHVLVLAHGTTVLRSQYYEEVVKMKPNFTYTHVESKRDIKNNTQVYIALPQTLKGYKSKKIDLLIVDEAHHFYFAPMVQDLINDLKPSSQLLLTGTPSLFIFNNFPIIPVTINHLLDLNVISDINIEIATSNYNFKIEDYNGKNDLKENVKINEVDTRDTLDDLLDHLVKKIVSPLKNNPVGYNSLKPIGSLTRLFGELKKTMIACQSQIQAKQVQKYFKEKEIDVALSISESDRNSSEIKRFMMDSKCLILIVVDRGILGFNFPDLENVIDLTTSQNIDKIFQLMCRVVRKSDSVKKKFFYKIVPHTLAEYYEYVMTLVLCLSDERYYTTYNGKNLLELKIPVVRVKKGTEKSKPTGTKRINKIKHFKVVDFMNIPAIRFFKDLLHKNHDILSSYVYTSLGNIKEIFNKNTIPLTKENIYAYMRGELEIN